MMAAKKCGECHLENTQVLRVRIYFMPEWHLKNKKKKVWASWFFVHSRSVFWEGKQPFKLLLFPSHLFKWQFWHPKRWLRYGSPAKNRLQIISLDTEWRQSRDGLFFLPRFSCAAALPPPVDFYRVATHARNPRGGELTTNPTRKRGKKAERKTEANKLSPRGSVYREKNCHCCWAKRSFNTRDWPLLRFFLEDCVQQQPLYTPWLRWLSLFLWCLLLPRIPQTLDAFDEKQTIRDGISPRSLRTFAQERDQRESVHLFMQIGRRGKKTVQ